MRAPKDSETIEIGILTFHARRVRLDGVRFLVGVWASPTSQVATMLLTADEWASLRDHAAIKRFDRYTPGDGQIAEAIRGMSPKEIAAEFDGSSYEVMHALLPLYWERCLLWSAKWMRPAKAGVRKLVKEATIGNPHPEDVEREIGKLESIREVIDSTIDTLRRRVKRMSGPRSR